MKIKSNSKTESIFSKLWSTITGDIGMYLFSLAFIFAGTFILSMTSNWGTAMIVILIGITIMFLTYDNSLDEAWGVPLIFLLFASLTAAFNTSHDTRLIKADIKNIVLSESNEKMIVYFNNMRKPMAVIDMSDNSTDFYTIKSNMENNLSILLEITEIETKDVYDVFLYDTSIYKYKFHFKVYQPTLTHDEDENYQDILTTTYMQNDTYKFEKAQF